MSLETVKDRLIAFLQEKHIPHSELARKMGVSPAYFSAMRKSLPEEKVQKLKAIFPDLNRDWLLYGEGEMLLSESDICADAELSEDSATLNRHMVPLLPVEAYAGSLSLWSRSVSPRDCDRIISPMSDVDFAIRISGDSMEPEFHSGAIIYIKRINEKAFIPWGNPMVIDSENGVLVKIVFPTSDNRFIEARSINPAYPPLKIPTDSIYGLYRVIGNVTTYTTM